MDRIKLGRALGYGTRHAARTLVAVAEAAAAPKAQPSAAPAVVSPEPARRAVASEPPRAPVPATRPRKAAPVRAASRSLWAPLAAFSGALWLRVTGLFFGLIAGIMASAAWRDREAARAGGADPVAHQHFWLFAGFTALFAYFAVSGFLRAGQRERQGTGRPQSR